jgi:hypothetical protein
MLAINANKAGLILGLIIGGWHLVWSILVASGYAQIVLDFILWLHFIRPVYVVEPFALGRSAILLGVTATLGYLLGCIFAALWNRLRP